MVAREGLSMGRYDVRVHGKARALRYPKMGARKRLSVGRVDVRICIVGWSS
jgi:hypothetical protein